MKSARGNTSIRISFLVLVLLFALPHAQRVDGADTTADSGMALLRRISKARAAVARKSIKAVVFIRVEKTLQSHGAHGQHYNDPFDLFGDDFRRRFFGNSHGRHAAPRKQMGQGSGFIITKDGYILTNNHVVGDADTITVKLHDGRELNARLIGTDPKSEVAVIKIDGKDFPTIELGDSDAIEVGESVLAIGNPFGLAETVTDGVISAKGRNKIGIADYENFIQTSAAINPGNSGGPLLTIEGKVIGINTAIYSQSGGSMGIGFAIPINMARKIKDQLIATGKVVRGYLGIGIQPLTPELAASFGLSEASGIVVANVMPGSAAEKAELRIEDVILELNGKKVDDTAAFRNKIALTQPNTTITLMISREGRKKRMKVTIGALGDPSVDAAGPSQVADKLGIAVQDIDEQITARFGYSPGDGVIITQVSPDSPAAAAGLQPGHLVRRVNRRPVRNTRDYEAALAQSKKTHTVLLLVTDGRYTYFVPISLE